MSIRASFSHETGNFFCCGMQQLNYLQRDPELVTEAEKTRMILNLISRITLHNMIVESLSMPAALNKKLKPTLCRRVSGRRPLFSESVR